MSIKLERISPSFENVWELIDFILDCIEYPQPNEFMELPSIEGKNLRDFAKEEYNKLTKKEVDNGEQRLR